MNGQPSDDGLVASPPTNSGRTSLLHLLNADTHILARLGELQLLEMRGLVSSVPSRWLQFGCDWLEKVEPLVGPE